MYQHTKTHENLRNMKKNNTKNETDKKNVNEKQPKYIKQIVKQSKTQFGKENNNKKTEDQGTKKNRGPHNKGRDDGDELTKASRDYIEDQGPKKNTVLRVIHTMTL